MMEKIRSIAFDIDDVLLDYHGQLINYHNRYYGTLLTKDDFLSYDFSKVFKCSKEEAIKRASEFSKSKYFRDIPPIKGSIEAIYELANKNIRLGAITSRNAKLINVTKNSLRIFFPEIKELYHSINHHVDFGNVNLNYQTKAQICIDNGFECIVEDSTFYAKECIEKGIKVFLVNQKWNENHDFSYNGLLTRVESAFEVLNLIE